MTEVSTLTMIVATTTTMMMMMVTMTMTRPGDAAAVGHAVERVKRSMADDKGWTRWFNHDTPDDGEGDFETTDSIMTTETICEAGFFAALTMCRVAGTNDTFDSTTASYVSDRLMQACSSHGVICLNRQQHSGRCNDYEVRFYCREMSDPMSNSLWPDFDFKIYIMLALIPLVLITMRIVWTCIVKPRWKQQVRARSDLRRTSSYLLSASASSVSFNTQLGSPPPSYADLFGSGDGARSGLVVFAISGHSEQTACSACCRKCAKHHQPAARTLNLTSASGAAAPKPDGDGVLAAISRRIRTMSEPLKEENDDVFSEHQASSEGASPCAAPPTRRRLEPQPPRSAPGFARADTPLRRALSLGQALFSRGSTTDHDCVRRIKSADVLRDSAPEIAHQTNSSDIEDVAITMKIDDSNKNTDSPSRNASESNTETKIIQRVCSAVELQSPASSSSGEGQGPRRMRPARLSVVSLSSLLGAVGVPVSALPAPAAASNQTPCSHCTCTCHRGVAGGVAGGVSGGEANAGFRSDSSEGEAPPRVPGMHRPVFSVASFASLTELPDYEEALEMLRRNNGVVER